MIMRIATRRILCRQCGASVQEPIDFCPDPLCAPYQMGCPLCARAACRDVDQGRGALLGTASLMKEYLRNIYKLADSYELARTAFLLWAEKAETSGIHCLKQMAKTIRRRLDGLLAYWKHAKLTSASQEGFNNKIGWPTAITMKNTFI